MSDESRFINLNEEDATDTTGSTTVTDYTQIASCSVGTNYGERRRQSLRAKLEREQYEQREEDDTSFVTTFRNLFKMTG